MKAQTFLEKYPEYGVDIFDVSSQDQVIIIEHAPKLFKRIRADVITEKAMFESFVPASNFSAMHNFTTG